MTHTVVPVRPGIAWRNCVKNSVGSGQSRLVQSSNLTLIANTGLTCLKAGFVRNREQRERAALVVRSLTPTEALAEFVTDGV